MAFKLSNGPLAIVVMPRCGCSRLVAGSSPDCSTLRQVAWQTLVGFGLVYGYWGAQLWAHFGNPVYPFYDNLFAQLRALTGWQP